MRRTGFTRVGNASWMCGLGVLIANAGPVMAANISIGGLFAGGGHGGTVIGGFVQIGEPRPRLVAPTVVVPQPVIVSPPVITERVWVSTPRVECRQVPVYDAFGWVIAYREECVTIPDGHWETITRPAPLPRVVVPQPLPYRLGQYFSGTVAYGQGHDFEGPRGHVGQPMPIRANAPVAHGCPEVPRSAAWKTVQPRSR